MVFWGLRSRLQVRVQDQVRESDPGPAPEPEHPDQIPDGRDPGPENVSPANHPVSGFPLLDCIPHHQQLNWVGSALRADLAVALGRS